MRATEILMEEHRVIEVVLDCLERLAERCAAEGHLDAGAALRALDFFRHFADRCHHGKEEDYLFRLLEDRGVRRDSGPTGVMLHEHEQGRRHVAAMAGAIPAAAEDAAARADFVSHARQYVRLLREHIRKEDHCLFPMADSALGEGDRAALLDAFVRVEEKEIGEGVHEHYLRLADGLADHLGVPRARAAGCGHCCGGHG